MTSQVALLPTNANLGRIMRIIEMNIRLYEPLFILNIQIFDINPPAGGGGDAGFSSFSGQREELYL